MIQYFFMKIAEAHILYGDNSKEAEKIERVLKALILIKVDRNK